MALNELRLFPIKLTLDWSVVNQTFVPSNPAQALPGSARDGFDPPMGEPL
jgi:hypothetical protein